MSSIQLKLTILRSNYAVCRFDPQAVVPAWAMQGDFFTVSRTQEELSIVCQARLVPSDIKAEKEWRVFKIEGPFAFSQIGILNSVTSVLANNGISLFAISTFDTDYIMVKGVDLDRSIVALKQAGHSVDDAFVVIGGE